MQYAYRREYSKKKAVQIANSYAEFKRVYAGFKSYLQKDSLTKCLLKGPQHENFVSELYYNIKVWLGDLATGLKNWLWVWYFQIAFPANVQHAQDNLRATHIMVQRILRVRLNLLSIWAAQFEEMNQSQN